MAADYGGWGGSGARLGMTLQLAWAYWQDCYQNQSKPDIKAIPLLVLPVQERSAASRCAAAATRSSVAVSATRTCRPPAGP